MLDLQALESRFASPAATPARALPANAVVLAVQQSGERPVSTAAATTIAWDAIPPGALDATIAALRAAGRPAVHRARGRVRSRASARGFRRAAVRGARLAAARGDPGAGAGAPVRSRRSATRYLAGERGCATDVRAVRLTRG